MNAVHPPSFETTAHERVYRYVERNGAVAPDEEHALEVELARLAAGELDGVFTNVDAHPWDTIAGVHLVRQAGGRVTDLDGERWRHDAVGLVASNGGVHDAVLAAANEI
jgi:3'-phosphoadenosine 5'-phosphosulfate (PAPS) 3'-phosphatase